MHCLLNVPLGKLLGENKLFEKCGLLVIWCKKAKAVGILKVLIDTSFHGYVNLYFWELNFINKEFYYVY